MTVVGTTPTYGDDSPTTAADVETSSGSTATVSPQTTTASELDAPFEESSSCTLTREMTEGPYYFDLDRSTLLTTQLFFDEDVTSAVHASQPYASLSGRDTFNDRDGIFDASLLLTMREESDGLLGVMTFNVEG